MIKIPAIKGKIHYQDLSLRLDSLDPYTREGVVTFDNLLKQKGVNFYSIVLDRPHKPRTTGRKSQNHAINGYIQQICNFTGDDFAYLKYQLKFKAIGRGYPCRTNIHGDPVPFSESEIDTIQAGYLIETIQQEAAEMGITLED